jgi:hypothetical protein
MVVSSLRLLRSAFSTTHIAKSVEVGRSREERRELAGAWRGCGGGSGEGVESYESSRGERGEVRRAEAKGESKTGTATTLPFRRILPVDFSSRAEDEGNDSSRLPTFRAEAHRRKTSEQVVVNDFPRFAAWKG